MASPTFDAKCSSLRITAAVHVANAPAQLRETVEVLAFHSGLPLSTPLLKPFGLP
jgi:hypothetical protein